MTITSVDSGISSLKPVDSFDLAKTMESGQVFNYRKLGPYLYLVQIGERATIATQSEDGTLILACGIQEAQDVWVPYFDLEHNYDLELESLQLDDFATRCWEVSKGIHILKQDPWEMCISYIISQRNKIEHISGIVKTLSKTFGTELQDAEERLALQDIYSFPTFKQLESCSLESLRECSVGFRDRYILDFVRYVNKHPECIEGWRTLSYGELLQALMHHNGIGPKVANCICLFGYHHLEAFPIDLWIQRIISGVYKNDLDPTARFGSMAGVVQQYMFNYVRNHGGDYNIG